MPDMNLFTRLFLSLQFPFNFNSFLWMEGSLAHRISGCYPLRRVSSSHAWWRALTLRSSVLYSKCMVRAAKCGHSIFVLESSRCYALLYSNRYPRGPMLILQQVLELAHGPCPLICSSSRVSKFSSICDRLTLILAIFSPTLTASTTRLSLADAWNNLLNCSQPPFRRTSFILVFWEPSPVSMFELYV